jgi:hypothetical protein
MCDPQTINSGYAGMCNLQNRAVDGGLDAENSLNDAKTVPIANTVQFAVRLSYLSCSNSGHCWAKPRLPLGRLRERDKR